MTYTIGEISKELDLPQSTIRYYDKEGLLPQLSRQSGIRQFSEEDLTLLKLIECLKMTGMPIKDIKQFCHGLTMGDDSLEERRQMFEERREVAKEQMRKLQETMDMIDRKCKYYEKACKAGTEKGIHF